VIDATSGSLVMEEVSGTPDWESLGRSVAAVHRTSAPSFGWHRDNVIGSLPQRNPWTVSWAEFYVEHRVRSWLAGLPAPVRHRLDRACDGALPELVDHPVTPSPIHGDLWAGNVVNGAFLIDPAVSFSDREIELAFAAVVGGIPWPIFAAYAEAWPLPAGWEERRPALQLYHLLVHVELFGAGYLPLVVTRLDRLRW
jgi:fructosamine-3-kinase